MTLHLCDVLLRSAFHTVIEGITNSRSVLQHSNEKMHPARLQLEEDTISYLSLIPDSMYSGKNDDKEDFKWYLKEAHREVKIYLRDQTVTIPNFSLQRMPCAKA